MVAAESGTGALIGATIGAYTVGEQTLARDLLPALGAETLVLADRNFLSHTLARDVLTPTSVLPDGTYLATLRPARKADRAADHGARH